MFAGLAFKKQNKTPVMEKCKSEVPLVLSSLRPRLSEAPENLCGSGPEKSTDGEAVWAPRSL